MVNAEMKGDKLHVIIDCSKEARENAQPSSTGKTKLLASTGGFTLGYGDVKVSLNATIPNK